MRDPGTSASRRALFLARATGATIAAVGAIHLLGWLTGVPASDAASTALTMKTNASLCLLLLGLALALLASRHPPRFPVRAAAGACAALALVIGGLTLAEHVTQVDLRLDQLLADEPPGAAGVTSPNRMGPPAALSFTLLGAALLLLSLEKLPPRLRTAHQGLAGVTAALALVPTMAYVYEADELYDLARYTAIAWPTAVSALALAIGVLLARPGAGFMAHVVAADHGGAVIRRLLPPMVLLPVALGWLRLAGERRGWFDAGMGTTLTMLIVVASLATLVVVAGRWVSESEAALRRRDEAARRDLAEMEAIYASAHIGLAVFDRELRYLRVNERLAAINGLPVPAHLGRTVRELLPDLAPEVERIAGRVLSTGEGVVDFEVSGAVPGRPGEVGTWLEQWIPMKDEAGEVVRINVVVEDVTERKRAEDGLRREMAERLRAQEAGRESEARFRELADAMPQLVWMASADGDVDYFNERVSEFAGLEQLPDGSWSWTAVLHPDDAERTLAAWQAALRSGEIYETEHRLRRTDGTWRWHLSRAVPVRDAAGALRRWYGTATDIHEFKEAEAALREQDRQKTEFLAVLSHELRNPLAPIRNAVEILERTPAGGDPARRAREVIERQVRQLARLVDDLLDVTRISSGKIRLQRERVDLVAVARAAVDDLLPLFAARGVRLDLALPEGEGLCVDGDRARLAQVVANLLGNAAKFSPPRSVAELRLARSGDDAVLRVCDAGLGISGELLPLVFEPFVQGDRTLDRSEGGLGLGLALVKSVVELHRGSVSAESDGPGRGSAFTVRLPLSEPVAASPGAPEPAVAEPGGRRVLVVEDNQDTALSLKEVLELSGHEVEVAHDGAAALRCAREFRPDVVLCDVGLPVKDGYQVARELRADPAFAGLTLVALTGYALQEDLARALEAGFDAHLRKPPDLESLQRLIAQARRR